MGRVDRAKRETGGGSEGAIVSERALLTAPPVCSPELASTLPMKGREEKGPAAPYLLATSIGAAPALAAAVL